MSEFNYAKVVIVEKNKQKKKREQVWGWVLDPYTSSICFISPSTFREIRRRRNKKDDIELLTATVVVVSYLKDLVCPFSKNTFRTFAIGGTHRSPREKADG